jgi:hypothetical protein
MLVDTRPLFHVPWFLSKKFNIKTNACLHIVFSHFIENYQKYQFKLKRTIRFDT